MIFTGTYEHTIDAKNRLAVPAEIRNQIMAAAGEGQTVPLYVTIGDNRSLCIYTKDGFEQRAQELDNSELDADMLLEYERMLFSNTRQVEMDKAGRVRLPDQLLKMAQLETEVVLLGVKDHLEVRDRQVWQQRVQQLLGENPQLLMNPRRAMKSTK